MTGESTLLGSHGYALQDRFSMALLDLDGVVYLLGEPIDGVVDAIDSARQSGMKIRFVTNNASKTAAAVAELLSGGGVLAKESEVRTSAQAVAAVLARRYPDGATVLAVGSAALERELNQAGMTVVRDIDGIAKIDVVAQGYGPTVGWKELAGAVIAVRRGAVWAATNPDLTMPSRQGALPGNGSMLQVVATSVGRRPDIVAGKPSPTMFLEAMGTLDSSQVLAVGDRADTDLGAARSAGVCGLLVFTGATTPKEALFLGAGERPSFLGWSLSAMNQVHPIVDVFSTGDSISVSCEGWQAIADIDGVRLARLTDEGDDLSALRTLCEVFWQWSDTRGRVALVSATNEAAAVALRRLGISDD